MGIFLRAERGFFLRIASVQRARERFAELSQRERQVAAAVAEGLSNAEIADRLFMSVGTVKATISNALTKLGLANRIQLAVLVHDGGRG